MLETVSQRLWILLAGVALTAFAGCADLDIWPFGRKTTDVVPGITPPAQRIGLLRQLRERAGKAKPEEQETVSAQVAAAYQQESDPLIRAETVRTLAHNMAWLMKKLHASG